MPSPNYPVLCCPLPYRVWSTSDNTRGPSDVFEAVDMPCPIPFYLSYSVDYIYDCCPLPSLHRLAGLPCRLFLSYGIQVVTREVHRTSLRRLICPAQDHFICLTVLIIYITFALSLTQMLVFLSLYVMSSILLSILVCAAASLLCACLVSAKVSVPLCHSWQQT